MSEGSDDPRTLEEPTTGRPVLLAPRRQKRPKLTQRDDAGPGDCPFCPGAEHRTPPEVDAIRGADSLPDGPGWRVRVFPNKYPASQHHEIVAEGDRHHEHPAELDAAHWADVVRIWQRRILAMESREGVGCAFLFKNVGARAGASIVHGHSQLLGLPEPPPRLLLERERAAAAPRCPWCVALEQAEPEGRLIVRGPTHAAMVPIVPRLAYETWLLPLDCRDEFVTTDADALAAVLHPLFCAVARALDHPALNLWLHRIPGAAFHWHFELQPRTSQLAGLELGGDMSINSVPASQAAARLRAGLNGPAGRPGREPSSPLADRG